MRYWRCKMLLRRTENRLRGPPLAKAAVATRSTTTSGRLSRPGPIFNSLNDLCTFVQRLENLILDPILDFARALPILENHAADFRIRFFSESSDFWFCSDFGLRLESDFLCGEMDRLYSKLENRTRKIGLGKIGPKKSKSERLNEIESNERKHSEDDWIR